MTFVTLDERLRVAAGKEGFAPPHFPESRLASFFK
jgi:hypothetical protein